MKIWPYHRPLPNLAPSKEATTFDGASDALIAAAAFESATEAFYQYETRAVFDMDRQLKGYQIRVMDMDGFGVGYLQAEA